MRAIETAFVVGGDEMSRLIREKDWSATPLGAVNTWPQSLRTTVSLCLASNFPINIIWGPEHTQIYNDGYRTVCGEAHPTALGQDYRETWASAWPAIGDSFERALSGQTSFVENQRMFLTRNGYLEETFFTFSLSPILDERGQIGGLFHPVTETTAAMLAGRRARALRDLASGSNAARDAEDLARVATDVLSAFDLDLPFLYVYHDDPDAGVYRRSHGFGAPAPSRLVPDAIARDGGAPWPFFAEDGAKSCEFAGVRDLLDGRPCGPYEEAPERAIVMPIVPPGGGRPPAVVIAGVSPRLPLDDSYRGFYDLIAVSLSAAMASVKARETERARLAALAEIDRAKTAFFSNVSHEFRTPLTLMLGPLAESLANAEALPADERERVTIAHRNGLRLLKLVNSLLDFSRVEAGRTNVAFEPTDLGAFTAEIASNFRSAIEGAGLRLAIDVEPDLEPIHIDREKWETIVLNLVSNAFKFTFEGEIRVRVARAPGGQATQVVVSDTGVGVPAEEIPRLFERFHRVAGTRGRTFEGSGIGLALVQELVKLHGGEIGVESAVGRGSAFTVSLRDGVAHLDPKALRARRGEPLSRSRADAFIEEARGWLGGGEASGRPAAGAAVEVGPIRGRVLLADDNADMRGYVARLLAAEGLTVETAADGAAALAAAGRQKPDLIVSDVMMPGLDGFELLRAVRQAPALRGTPVILLSARAGEEARVEGLAAGADDYLVKPFSARELVARVTASLHRARDRRVAALAQSEERLRLALVAAGAGAWRWRAATGAVEWSPHCYTLFGVDPSVAVVHAVWRSCIHPDDVGPTEAHVAAAAMNGDDIDVEYRVRLRDGGVRWIRTIGRVDPFENGTPERMSGLHLDVTGERAAKESLRASEERFRMLIEEAPDAIMLLDPDRDRLVDANRAAERLFGVSRAELIEHGTRRFYPPGQPDDLPTAETYRDHNRRALAGEEVRFERKVRRPSGEDRICQVTLVRLSSSMNLLRGSLLDVTEQRAAEESLRASEGRFRMLVEEAPDAILLYDYDQGRYVGSNKAAERLFGLPGDEILRVRPFEFYPLPQPDGKPISDFFMDYLNRALAGEEVRFERRIRRPSGEERICHVTVVRLPSEARLLRTSLVDLTERKAAEAELFQAQRDIVARQEGQRQRIARELHDSLGQYLAAMSIKLELLRRAVGDDSPVKAGLDDMKALTSTVGTEVSRIAWELRPTAIDDIGLEAAVRRFVEQWAERSGIRFDLHLALKGRRLPPEVEATLYRVLQEGVTNVVKHARARNVGVVLKAAPEGVVMMIEDDGAGFDPDSLARSTRLGLRGMRERLGAVCGGLEIESAPGRGTTLIIRVALDGSAAGAGA